MDTTFQGMINRINAELAFFRAQKQQMMAAIPTIETPQSHDAMVSIITTLGGHIAWLEAKRETSLIYQRQQERWESMVGENKP